MTIKDKPTFMDYMGSLWSVATGHAFAKKVGKDLEKAKEETKETLVKTGKGLNAAIEAFKAEFEDKQKEKPCSSKSSDSQS